LIEEAEVEELARKERGCVSAKDKFEPHGLPEGRLVPLVAQLRAVPNLSAVFLVKKRVLFFPHRPLYVIGYTVTGRFVLDGTRRATEVLERIEESVQLPGDTLIVNIDDENWIPFQASAGMVIEPVGSSSLSSLGRLVVFGAFLLILILIVLTLIASRPKSNQRDAQRARIILGASQGLTNTEIARRERVSLPTVGKWREAGIAPWPSVELIPDERLYRYQKRSCGVAAKYIACGSVDLTKRET
jgi:uncharacterized membrane protein YphA (DoxX/SURF4 family)